MPVTVAPYARRHFPTIAPNSYESIGVFLSSLLQVGNNVIAWPLTNLALLVPFTTWETLTIKEVFWMNGTGTGGNADVGIYDSIAVNRLASLGSTGKGAASAVVTSTTWTDYVLQPGDYYMAISVDGVTNVAGAIPAAGTCAAAGMLEATSAFPLPSTISPVRTTRAVVPWFGLCLEGTAL